MPLIYVVHNNITKSLEYLSEEQMEQYQPELQSGVIEIVEVINSEE